MCHVKNEITECKICRVGTNSFCVVFSPPLLGEDF